MNIFQKFYKLEISFKIGLLVTSVYFTGISIWAIIDGFLEISLNEKGDFLAGVLAPLAFFWFILAYLLQRKELSENTTALENQEIQLRETKEQFRLQQLENSLFNLLKIQNDIRTGIKVNGKLYFNNGKSSSESYHTGKDAFTLLQNHLDLIYTSLDELLLLTNHDLVKGTAFYNNLIFINIIYDINEDIHHSVANKSKLEKAKLAYKLLFKKHINNLGHYNRHLFHILNYIEHKNYLADDQKAYYSKLIQAQLSDSELSLIFYNGLLFPKMKKALVKNDILENLNPKSLILEEHKVFYPIEIKQSIFD